MPTLKFACLNRIITEPHYFPSARMLWQYIHADEIIFETQEHFIGQTSRSRCRILGANGPITLSVPVRKGKSKLPFKDVLISYDHPWQQQHERAIGAAYRSSPYYIFYEDDIRELIRSKKKYMLDLNIEIYTFLSKVYKLKATVLQTAEYNEVYENDIADLRNANEEKLESGFGNKPYIHVFSDRFPFTGDLSALDRLFNTGPTI